MSRPVAELVDAYLALLGWPARPPADLATLRQLQRRHLLAFPYENVEIMLGRGAGWDPVDVLTAMVEGRNPGYCFHQNGALEVVLRELGFEVSRRASRMIDDGVASAEMDHLALLVTEVASPEGPGGSWWLDAGMGDAQLELVAVRPGRIEDGPFRYQMVEVAAGGWTFRHDPSASFGGGVIDPVSPSDEEIRQAHARLSGPGAEFARLLVVQRRTPDAAETIRGLRYTRIGAGATAYDLEAYDDWRDALLRLGMKPVDESELRALFARMSLAHQEWKASRPGA